MTKLKTTSGIILIECKQHYSYPVSRQNHAENKDNE